MYNGQHYQPRRSRSDSKTPTKQDNVWSRLIEQAPDRLDLRHSLAVTLVRMGEAKAARIVTKDAIAMAFEMQDQAAATLLSQLYMVDAEAFFGSVSSS